MDILDQSRLEREGAQAAARGASWRANPFLLRDNMPHATGESLADWSGRHDAWQRGFEGYFQLGPDFARRRKEPLSAAVLKALVARRLHWLSAGQRTHAAANPRTAPRIPLPSEHERDHAGRNWNMELLGSGAEQDLQVQADYRAVVERLRCQYDIAQSADAVSAWPHMVALQAAGSQPEGAATAGGRLTGQTGAACAGAGPGPDNQAAVETAEPGAPCAPTEPSPQRLRELGIRRIGWRYEYRGYRYEHLADALAYASLPRNADDLRESVQAPLAPDEPPATPCAQDLAVMAAWDITFEAGVYRFGPYRYDRLADAVAYAALLAQRSAQDSGSRR
jgi:hypothetical protein